MDTNLINIVKNLPQSPGVYVFKDNADNILYVGKAKNIFKRVNSYFYNTENTIKTERLLNHSSKIDYIVTSSELEALILECNLIKEYRPRFNIRLKDDKNYPYIRVDINDDWPFIDIVRSIKADKSLYFGPFASKIELKKTINLIRNIFKFRTCKTAISAKKARPCLDFHLGKCSAPCAGLISLQDYRELIEQTIKFLNGQVNSLIKELKQKMISAANKNEFEKAARLRDSIKLLQSFIEFKNTLSHDILNCDVIAVAIGHHTAIAELMKYRNGLTAYNYEFILENTESESKEDILKQFIKTYYTDNCNDIPEEIILDCNIKEKNLIKKWLKEISNHPVKITVGLSGSRLNLIETARKNALHKLEENELKKMSIIDYSEISIYLKNSLLLKNIPRRIEAYDISNIKGQHAVGSMVVFKDGKANKNQYRRFKIKHIKRIDDYSMMEEILNRRFARYSKCDTNWAEKPDLLLIDGGKGHLNTAINTLEKLGYTDVDIVAFAKGKNELYSSRAPDMHVDIPHNSHAYFLLQRIRDEAHRFAISYHRKIKRKNTLTSELETISGIGKKRSRELIAKFGSISKIANANINDLLEIKGINEQIAHRIKNFLSTTY